MLRKTKVKAAEDVLRIYPPVESDARWRNMDDAFIVNAAKRALMKRINKLEKEMKAVREDFKAFNSV